MKNNLWSELIPWKNILKIISASENKKATTYVLLPRTWVNVVKIAQGLDFCSSTFNI
jgi:hypothetical protein